VHHLISFVTAPAGRIVIVVLGVVAVFLFGKLVSGIIRRVRDASFESRMKCVERNMLLGFFFVATALLIVTNVEIISLVMSLLLVGVVTMSCSFASTDASSTEWAVALRRVSVLLAAYFLTVGIYSCVHHSRLLYSDDKDAAYTPAGNILGATGGYFEGVVVTPLAAERLRTASEFLTQDSASVYWGPGMEILNRVKRGVSAPALPLWYHLGVTVRDVDARQIIESIEQSGCSAVVVDASWYDQFPKAVQVHFESGWTVERSQSVIVFRRPGR
jgi:hypothetical protein